MAKAHGATLRDRVPVEEIRPVSGEIEVTAGACAAGNYAIGRAADLIRLGRATRVLAGGAEAFSRVAFTGFARLGALAREACRPFSADRDGIVLGEGAGMVVVESAASARGRGATVLAGLPGFGLSSDAHHIVSPDPEAGGAVRALEEALDSAGLASDDVDYVCAHGTGTEANDQAEVAAARRVFGGRRIPMSSLKALTGHALGASSAIEAVACVRALAEQTAPPTWNFRRRDPDCDWDVVPNEPRPLRLDVVMSSAYAFGGVNAALVLTKAG
jgi:3-oxoacyl-[acyl-carrier-protein] synthase II